MTDLAVPAEWRARLQGLLASANAPSAPLPPLHCEVLGVASDGFTNLNLVIGVPAEYGGATSRWLLRLGTPRTLELAIDRAVESRVWTRAARAGLAVSPLVVDQASGDALTPFVAAPSWAARMATFASDPGVSVLLERLTEALRALHSLEVEDVPVITLSERVQGLIALGTRRGWAWPSWLIDTTAHVEDALRNTPGRIALTHGDVNPWNVLQGDSSPPTLLDWEYAAYADPLFDVASVLGHWPFDSAGRERWIASYGVAAEDRKRLAANERLFHLREFAWAGAMQAMGYRTADIEAQYAREAAWLTAS